MPAAGTAPHSTPSDWLQSLGYTGGYAMAEIADPDGDGVPNWMEYVAGTNPTNRQSVFKFPGLSVEAGGRQLALSTESNRVYRVDWSEDLKNWQTLQANIEGDGQPKIVADNAGPAQRFYRAQISAAGIIRSK